MKTQPRIMIGKPDTGAFTRVSDASSEDMVINDGIGGEVYLEMDDLVDLLPIIEQHLIENGR